jgi:hypothetical protein
MKMKRSANSPAELEFRPLGQLSVHYRGDCSSNAIISLSLRQTLVADHVVDEATIDDDDLELEGDLGALRVAAVGLTSTGRPCRPSAVPSASKPASEIAV